ncbi:MAG: enoyl-CoA hydratase/isomerase family protein [Deltaproteobacteria bacterium]|nr:MAG: enoyl-CoA hydratase/isomerase family protein [Deltaproteobacteria bacterium]
MNSPVLTDVVGGVATLTLNRPDKLNALSSTLIRELVNNLKKASEDPHVGVIVITGKGRAFSAGGDVEEILSLAKGPREERVAYLHLFLEMIDAVRFSPKPVIAAVNGICIGGGNELHAACDLSVASEKARFGQAGPKVGSAPVLGGTQLLPLIVGERRAREIILTCRLYTAEEAKEMGLVNAVVPHDHLEDHVRKLADSLLEKSPGSLALSKESLNRAYRDARPSILEEIEKLADLWGSPEAIEGLSAFLEKREPRFRSS